MIDRVPPHDLSAEQGLIGSALLNDETYQADVPADAFYRTGHRLVWETMRTMLDRGERLDLLTVAAALKAAGLIEKAGGSTYLSRCTNNVVVEHAEDYAGLVLDNATRRRAIVCAREVAMQAYSGAPVDDLAAAAGKVAQSIVTRTDRLQFGKDVARELVDELQRLYAADEEPGFSTGFPDLDKIMRFHGGEVTALAGRPGMGKSALALDCTRAALIAGYTVYWATLEMSNKKLMKRILSSLSGIDGRKFRGASFGDRDWPKLTHALGRVAKTNLWMDETPAQTSGQIRSGVHRIAAKEPVALVVVDYIQIMREPGQGDRRQQLDYAMSRLVGLAKEVGCHVLVLSQLNRDCEKRNPPRPQMSDLKESGGIEQDSDNVLLLYRDEYYQKEKSKSPGVGEIIIGKCREGETGFIEVLWHGPTTSYRPYEKYRK